ncbi:chloramphenicol-sensitive protein RarD [Brevundimonas bullata]|uniref:Chloramphenicol-sensitive protein RarD n=1 Tax=Brevundimonas bullata TaxID=13160 RepID=A0A7W7N236_9CAUL|nr:EamA family transporter RarD [Brevundimonas bullata]MBB4796925.1 chloramphenicol-sensitive protein RarD [Brevundimonas bullata]MBB6381884.1 chloramphenicol-sensitive protein RarD [Brevundimonas bullata]
MTASPSTHSSEARTALAAGVICYLIWGFVPLIFQQMAHQGANAWEIMGHRAVWGLVWSLLLVLLARQWSQVMAVLRQPKVLGWLSLSAILIATNWTVYIVAVNNGRTLDASLGYYLNPLLNMAAGAWLFRERIDWAGKIAMALAAIGVVLQTLALGHAPWVSLVLALTFAAYGIIRKRVSVDAQTGLFLECLLLALPGLIWLIHIETTGAGHFTATPAATLWLLFAGPATVIPLALFAWAARRMPLSSMGFLQFLAPTIVFIIGALQGEALGPLRIASFVFIWVAVGVFAVGAVLKVRRGSRTAETIVAPEPGLLDDPAEDRMAAMDDAPPSSR